jgi:DNA helicase-2/ATP-dependent DNA helicase PcrA
MNFTQEQKNIFEFIEKQSENAIIDAVAGAGKTTTIIQCAKYIEDKSKILFCAFNRSISQEIAAKFHKIGINEVTVKTIHALGYHILKDNNNTGLPLTVKENYKYAELLRENSVVQALEPYYKKILKINKIKFEEYDDRAQFAAKNFIKKINIKLIDINDKYRATLTKENDIDEFRKLVEHFNIFNSVEIGKHNFAEEIEAYFEAHKILLAFGNKLAQRRMVIDYTDMLYLPYKWNQYPVKKYDYLFIDECQDLSKSQLAIAFKYAKKNSRILAVGDPRQSIYGFNGADTESFARIKKFTEAKQLPLTICFRCPKKVIEIAQQIRQDIVGNKKEEGIVQYVEFENLIKIAKPNDLIISRFREPILILVFRFLDNHIKVQIHEDEVLEILEEIKKIFTHKELNAVISQVPGGFKALKKAVSKRWQYIIEKEAQRIIDSVERNLYIKWEQEILEMKLNFLENKYEQWKNHSPTLMHIVKRIKDFISARENAIKLSTIHRAKGLENNRVFILDYDLLPYYRQDQKEWQREQELNLKYVAVTRALQELYLVQSKKIETLKKEETLFDNLPTDW